MRQAVKESKECFGEICEVQNVIGLTLRGVSKMPGNDCDVAIIVPKNPLTTVQALCVLPGICHNTGQSLGFGGKCDGITIT